MKRIMERLWGRFRLPEADRAMTRRLNKEARMQQTEARVLAADVVDLETANNFGWKFKQAMRGKHY